MMSYRGCPTLEPRCEDARSARAQKKLPWPFHIRNLSLKAIIVSAQDTGTLEVKCHQACLSGV